jgi:tRNA A-37 threonylcarbamoyl transferase component Bud32
LRLTEPERSSLGNVASSLVDPSSISALCAYGSKVAGYARPDSDYDLIIVSKRFRGGIRYKYVDRPIPASALIVDEHLLWQDARTSYLGEFVVGRLLNVYEPISNPQLFRSVEVEYKRRVIVEAVLELSSDYGDFGRHLIIPFDYFLFDKLKKRAMVYPPALYSYVQTYTCPMKAENLDATVDGFAAAAEALKSRGLLLVDPSGIRLLPEKVKGDAFTKVQSLFSLTTRGVAQYAVHGYAGRVGLSVFRREAQSKLRRMRENPPPLASIERPLSLLRLEEGTIIPDASLLVKAVAAILGFEVFSTSERDIGEPYSTTHVLTFRDSSREVSVVVKNYSDLRSLKWALLGVWASAAKKFSMSPLARIDREYGMTRRLRSEGFLIPTILGVAPDERVLVKEFVGGPTLAGIIDGVMEGDPSGLASVSAYAELMARMHAAGLALGDTKASNIIVSPRGLYLTDLEQALPGGDKSWDIAEFLYYTAKFSNRDEGMKTVAEAFLESYSKSGGTASIREAGGSKYLRPFRPFLTPRMASMLRELMSSSA